MSRNTRHSPIIHFSFGIPGDSRTGDLFNYRHYLWCYKVNQVYIDITFLTYIVHIASLLATCVNHVDYRVLPLLEH